MLVDADAATNGLSLFYLRQVTSFARERDPDAEPLSGVFETESSSIEPDTFKLSDGLWLAPAAYRFGESEHFDVSTYEGRIRHLVDAARSKFHYILLDSQAGSDAFVAVSIDERVSDEVVIVTEYDPISLAGVERLKGLFPDQLRYSRTWMLINKMLPEFVKSYRNFMEIGRYASPIPWNAEVVRAFSKRRLALDTELGNDYTLAVLQTVRSLLEEDKLADLDTWVETRAAGLRDPIAKQYAEAEAELSAIVRERVYRDMRRSKRRKMMTLIGGYLALLPAGLAVVGVLGLEGLWSFTDVSDSLVVVLALVGSALGMSAVYIFLGRTVRVSDTVGDARLSRREEFLERRLGELEALKAADLDALVRSRVTRAAG